MKFKELIVPGHINPYARVFLFILFIIVTILQIYFALIIEVQLAEENIN
jgi:hypothetical protein